MTRPNVRALLYQAGGWGAPASEDIDANVAALTREIHAELTREPADLVVLPELATTPYFCCSESDRFSTWAQPIPGPATEAFAEVARRHRAVIVLPLFERGADGQTYNSAAIISADGELVHGQYRNLDVSHYRKCHIPLVRNPPDTNALETLYFTPGGALPVFEVMGVRVGVLICFDRWFPEAWRVLRAQGAEVIIVPMVAWGFVESTYLQMIVSRAVENNVFVLTCNRSAFEELDGIGMDNFGRSAALAPDGSVLAIAAPRAGTSAVRATLELDQLAEQSRILPLLASRRIDLYEGFSTWT